MSENGNGYGSTDAEQFFQMRLAEALSDLVAEVVEDASHWMDLPDREDVVRVVQAGTALAHACGPATTRRAMLKVAAVAVAAAARIPDNHHVEDEIVKKTVKPFKKRGVRS